MRRSILFLAGALFTACGSILGVEPLKVDGEPAVTVPDAAEADPGDATDTTPHPIDATAFSDGGSTADVACFATALTLSHSITTDGDNSRNPWESLPKASKPDGEGAIAEGCCTISLSSQTLFATDFRFAIPVDATIQGVTIQTTARSGLAGSVTDQTVELVSGSTRGLNLKLPQSYGTDFETRTYGNANSADGLLLTPALVNAPDFGFVFDVLKTSISGAAGILELDDVELTVFYCE